MSLICCILYLGIQPCLFLYKLEPLHVKWDESFDRCKSAGLELAVFNDANMMKKTLKQLSLLLKKTNEKYAWLGGKAIYDSWYWMSGKSKSL